MTKISKIFEKCCWVTKEISYFAYKRINHLNELKGLILKIIQIFGNIKIFNNFII